MGERDLTIRILQQVAIGSMQYAGGTAGETRSVLAQCGAAATRFDADQPYRFVADEGVEQADGVAASADASESGIREAAFAPQNFRAGFEADHAMEIAHHHRIGMRAKRRAQQ